ncbi:MAG: EAL domain-containing protein [Gammaproteobacteria bacterium]|nr:EAL domain-containing protein [Gammaproteobacteria bacterium]
MNNWPLTALAEKAGWSASIKRSVLPLLLVSTILLPAVVASQILWTTLTEQIYDDYEKRLATGLQTFELLLTSSFRTLHDTVSRTAADNTVRITMELEILPQLRRYLHSQNQASSVDFLTVAKPDGQMLLSAEDTGSVAQAGLVQCDFSSGEASNRLSLISGSLVLSRSLPILHQDSVVGFVCGGLVLNAPAYLNQLRDTLGGLPQMWLHDQLVPSPFLESNSISSHRQTDAMFEFQTDSGYYKGMLNHTEIGGQPLTIGILITLAALEQGVEKAFLSILIAFSLIALIVFLALRYLSLQREAEKRLALEQERALVTLSSIGDAVLTTDVEGRITYLNAAAENLTGYSFNRLRGQSWQERVRITNEETGKPVPNPIKESLEAGRRIAAPFSSVLKRRDGTETAVHYSAAPIGDKDQRVNGVVLVLRDVNQERQLQRKLSWKATRDDLTGLFNRNEFRHRLHQAIENARERRLEHGLLFLDLDQFKVINDSCGHQVGDLLLKSLSSLLKLKLRSTDTLARLGGDEFGILLEGCPAKQSLAIAETIRETVTDYRFSHEDKVFDIGASIGVAIINEQTDNVENLMSLVDAACYSAKELGRNRVHFSEQTKEASEQRLQEMQWATRIKDALKGDRFELFYQPIIPITGSLNGAALDHGEILVRMIGDEGNLIPPGAFIPSAERYGLMPDIDRWIIKKLFSQEQLQYQALGAKLKENDSKSVCLYTINLSGASLLDLGFLDFIKDQMRDQGIPPQLVCFEITETAAITHLDQASRFMQELKAMGCRFLLDDFGSGMSSFGYLKNLPVDVLKIDGQFVKDILHDPIDRAMVKAINEIGHTMGLETVAEFVENEAILEELHRLGVDYAQGYGVSQPRPLKALGVHSNEPAPEEVTPPHHYIQAVT